MSTSTSGLGKTVIAPPSRSSGPMAFFRSSAWGNRRLMALWSALTSSPRDSRSISRPLLCLSSTLRTIPSFSKCFFAFFVLPRVW